MTGQGIDISEWQGAVDHGQVHAAGVDFEIIRAGYGLEHPDPLFAQNWAGAKAAGTTRAAYLWLRASQNALSQAAFLAAAGADGELAPWVDFESVDGSSPGAALAGLARCLDELERRGGRTPVIYTGPAFWIGLGRAGADRAWRRYPLAIAHYGVAAPTVPAPWTEWSYWQHTSAGHVPGIAGPVDLDISVTPLWTAAPANPQEHPFMHLNAPVVGPPIATSSGQGYWQIAADGGVFAWGDAQAFPDNPYPSQHLNAPVVGAAKSPSDKGLWLQCADGGVLTLGDAQFKGAIPQL